VLKLSVVFGRYFQLFVQFVCHTNVTHSFIHSFQFVLFRFVNDWLETRDVHGPKFYGPVPPGTLNFRPGPLPVRTGPFPSSRTSSQVPVGCGCWCWLAHVRSAQLVLLPQSAATLNVDLYFDI